MRDSYILTVEEDPETGDLVLPFTDEILAKCGWQVGDTLTWTVKTNGSIIISKKEIENEVHPNS